MYEVSEAYKSAIAQPTRNFRLSGNIRMQSGDTIALSDSNVVGEMKIETQCMSGSSSEQILDIGAVCAAKLTMTVKNASSSDSFADARVRPLVGLEISQNSFEDIPMGIFYVDNTTVERVKNRVTFSAYDKMIFLHFLLTETMRGNMKNMPPFAACAYVCGLAGIQMAQPSAEVTAFPNGSVLPDYSDASIETARDLIMWCAQIMGCFARIDRHGRLEFVQLKAENDEHGMIIPVREIAARQRYSTKFADGVIRITRLTMKKSDGKAASAAVTYTGSTKRSAELELEQNPLILSLTDKTVKECLRDILSTVKTAYFRPFQSEIASDPALDAGDYVRLRGGSIDTNRGYGTGIITHNVWRYRGKHRIVNVGSVPAMYQLDDESSAAETAAVSEIALLSENTEDDDGSDDVDGSDLVYVPPKSQLEKEIDGLRGKVGTSSNTASAISTYEYLTDSSVKFNDTTYTIEKNETGLISKITDSLGNSLKPVVRGEITDIALHNAALWGAVMARGIGKAPEVEMSDMSGIEYYYIPETRATSSGIWKNYLDGEAGNKGDILLPNGAAENGHALNLQFEQYGQVETIHSMKIFYCLAKAKPINRYSNYSFLFTRSGESIGYYITDAFINYRSLSADADGGAYLRYSVATDKENSKQYEFARGTNYTSFGDGGMEAFKKSFSTAESFLDYHVYSISIKKSSSSSTPFNVYWYIDGECIGNTTSVSDEGTRYYLNSIFSSGISFGGLDASYLAYAMGTGDTYHTPEMVKANSEWLLNKARGDWKD